MTYGIFYMNGEDAKKGQRGKEYYIVAGEDDLSKLEMQIGNRAIVVGKASTYTGEDKIGDIYFFDGAQWNKAGE